MFAKRNESIIIMYVSYDSAGQQSYAPGDDRGTGRGGMNAIRDALI